jgi:hypothetical protein
MRQRVGESVNCGEYENVRVINVVSVADVWVWHGPVVSAFDAGNRQ